MSNSPVLRQLDLSARFSFPEAYRSILSKKVIARILDQLAFKTDRIESQFQSQPNLSLRKTILSLNKEQRGRLLSKVSENSLQTFLSIGQETDQKIVWERLFHLGQRELMEGKNELAQTIFLHILHLRKPDRVPLPIIQRTRALLNLLQGHGSFADQMEVSTTRFIPNTLNPYTIAPMMIGTIVGKAIGTWALGRIAVGSKLSRLLPTILQRGLGARFTAASISLLGEAPTFFAANLGLRNFAGESLPTHLNGYLKEAAATTMTLGLLKFTSYLGNQLFLKLHRYHELNIPTLERWEHFNQIAIPTASMWWGMFAAHKAEAAMGLRAEVSGLTGVMDITSSLFSLKLGVRLGNGLAGSKLANLERNLEIKNNIYSNLIDSHLSFLSKTFDNFLKPNIRKPAFAFSENNFDPIEINSPKDQTNYLTHSFFEIPINSGGKSPVSAQEVLSGIRNVSLKANGVNREEKIQIKKTSDFLKNNWRKLWGKNAIYPNWKILSEKVSKKLVKFYSSEIKEHPLLITEIGNLLFKEIEQLFQSEPGNLKEWVPHLHKISITDLIEIDSKYSKGFVNRALNKSHNPKDKVLEYRQRYQQAYEVALHAMENISEGNQIARTIAKFSYPYKDSVGAANRFLITYQKVFKAVSELLDNIAEPPISPAKIASSSFHQKSSTKIAIRKTFTSLIGQDPAKEIPKISRDLNKMGIPSLEKNISGRKLLIAALEESLDGEIYRRLAETTIEEKQHIEMLLDQLSSEIVDETDAKRIAKTIQDIDLNDGMAGDWEGVKDFIEGFSTSTRVSGDYKLHQRDIIQNAPVFKDRGQFAVWIIENKNHIDQTNGSQKRYSYYTVAKSLFTANKIIGDTQKFISIGSLLEFEYLNKIYTNLKEILNPSESFQLPLKGIRRYLNIRKVSNIEAPFNENPIKNENTFWKIPKVSIPFNKLIKDFLKSKNLTQEDLNKIIRKQIKGPFDIKVFIKRNSNRLLPFPILKIISQIFDRDPRELIYSYNLIRFPFLDPSAWTTKHYPIFLEGPHEARLIEMYDKNDSKRKSMGWLIFSTRKNPFNYKTHRDLAKEVGVVAKTITELESNIYEPNLFTLNSLIKFLKDAPRDLIHAINHTFYPNLIPILQSLFPNQAIHINNKSDDVKKLDYYFQNPSSLGRLFFGARKRLKGKPNPKDLAIKLGKSSEKYINDREWDRLKPTPSYFSDWVWFFNQLDLSLEDHLLPHLKQFGIHETSPSFLLAKAMNGMTGLELAVKTGLKPITITNILNGKETQLSLDQLFELKKILPHLNPHFFSQLSPQVTNIFPEITREPHSLNVPREDQIEAEKINLASLVANYRTNHRLTNIEMAVILGLSEASVRRLAMGVKVDFDLNALSRISAVLEINPRYLLLKFKPQILKIFPIDDQISETPNHLAPHWEKLKSYEPISNYLKQLRKTKKINQEVVNKLIKKITGKSINVSRYENNKNLPIPFSILKILSYIYDVNLNDIIYSSNLTLFPNLDPDIWMMPTYPIYLEKPHEAKLIEFFNRTDPEKRSIGWLIFSFLKNPFNYKTIQQFASETKIGKSSLDHIIHHRYIPNLRTIEKLSSSLPFSWEQIIEAINHTFHQDLIETLTEVFPEKTIWIDPNSNDIEKVKLYAKNPGSIGKVLFEFRKSQPDLPGVVEMSLRFKKANDYWFKREMNQVEVTPDNLHSWIWIFQKLKIPLETLKPFLNKIQLTSDSPRYLLSVAMGEETLVALAKRSGVDVSILVDLNTSKIKPTAKTLLKLKTALPTLEIGKLYRTIFPELIEFFPEAESSIPYLNLTPVSIADAKSLEVNELVFDYMKKNNISAKKMAKILGVSDTTILYFIKNKSRLRYDYLLLKMAVLLNIPRQTLYLHYHPEILDFFSINNPELLK